MTICKGIDTETLESFDIIQSGDLLIFENERRDRTDVLTYRTVFNVDVLA